MMLHAVTISGADDQTDPEQLARLSEQFSFVEWGVLLSSSKARRPRYPTAAWLDRLQSCATEKMRISGHLCGALVKEICRGEFPVHLDRPLFRRMQLNLAGHFGEIKDPQTLVRCLPRNREYILQIGHAENDGLRLAESLQSSGLEISILLDSSGGRGLSPSRWPALVPTLRCGFAGGLGPDNLEQELANLREVAGSATIWVDMESRVRTTDGTTLDLSKVRACLEIVQSFVDVVIADPNRDDENL